MYILYMEEHFPYTNCELQTHKSRVSPAVLEIQKQRAVLRVFLFINVNTQVNTDTLVLALKPNYPRCLYKKIKVSV